MAVVKPDVVLISSDDDDDCEVDFVMAAVNPEIVLISSDDENGERNLDEGLESEEEEGAYIELDDHESDKDEEKDVEKSNEGECFANCDERSGLVNQGGNDLHVPSLYECKTYLRKHGMRVSGTKEECIQRIEEHERLKDGKGESFFPKSSFSINCTGDACRGDVVLFKQNMYNSQRNKIGRRTVTGRIINESYGASTQQHTFSVEVLWSKWFKKLDPLSILLVKGRNLYRFGTFRQPWKTEAERSKVLEEKHERGREARRKRKLRETEFGSSDYKGKKYQKVSHSASSQSKHITGLYKHKYVNKNTTDHNQAVLFQNTELKRSVQLTHHSDPNRSMYSDHHLQEASLPPCSSSDPCHHNNEQPVPNQALPQPPDLHHHDSESPVCRSTEKNAKLRFPESSFSINCTGDAREKDIILFKERVFLRGKKLEKRTVAGRIVKVRQCGSTDKHRFVIKVLWTIPSIDNRKRSTLLVRSRNLYKFGTFRQPWRDEAMRSKVLEEKKGPATRKRKLKKTDVALSKNKGVKRQKVSHNGASPSKQPTKKAKNKHSKRKDASATLVKETKKGSKKKSAQLQKTKVKKSKQQTPNPNMNLNPSRSTNPNLDPNSNSIMSTTSNPNPNPSPNLNLNLNQQQTFQLHPNQNMTLNSSPSTNPNLDPKNLIMSTTTNPNPSTHLNLNPNTRQNQDPTSCQNPNLNKRQNKNKNLNKNTRQNKNPKSRQNPNPRQNQNPNPRKNTNPNRSQNPNPNRRQNSNPNKHQNPHPSTRKNQNLNLKSNPISITTSNSNPSPHLNPGQHTNLNTCQNPKPNARQNPHPNMNPNSDQISSTTLNPNLHPHPHPNNHIPAHQLQELSLSLPYDRTLMPNQPPVWIPPNQPPFGFPGYGGQWGPNHLLIHSLAYQMTVEMLAAAVWYQQPR